MPIQKMTVLETRVLLRVPSEYPAYGRGISVGTYILTAWCSTVSLECFGFDTENALIQLYFAQLWALLHWGLQLARTCTYPLAGWRTAQM